jgi:predicted nucleic acid-binding protein
MIHYLDTSVAAHILLEDNDSAVAWFEELALDEPVQSSRLLELELLRLFRRCGLELSRVDDFLEDVTLLVVDDALLKEAAAIRPHVRSLDAIHLASAQRLGAASTTIVTHDAQMARATDALGFALHDPVT